MSCAASWGLTVNLLTRSDTALAAQTVVWNVRSSVQSRGERHVRLFTIEGVAADVGWWLSRRRGLRMMEVPTPAIRKTSTCLTLPSPALT